MLGGAEYDSTWAESEGEAEPVAATSSPNPKEKEGVRLRNADVPYRWRNWRAAKDLQRYRHDYPDLDNKVEDNENINFQFYMNQACSQPDEWTVEEMITNWKGKYEQLERNHSYIQWLFPLRERGMNWYAKELTRQEIELFKKSKIVKKRLIKSYKMMLDFYGIKLVNRKTGVVKRAHNWNQRFTNLNLRTHNNLRITRILKCLGEMGFEHYQPPLVKFFLTETLINKQLPNVKESVLDYFLYTIRSKSERRKLILYARQHYQPLSDFVWGPPKGTEHRFSHILTELKKEEEAAGEEASDEDTEEEISFVSLETGEGCSWEQGSLTKQKSSDTGEKRTNCVKDTEERSEGRIETRKLDAGTSQEEYSAEEKSNGDGKPSVSENKPHQNGHTEKQTECEEQAVREGIKSDIKELLQGDKVLKNCETKHEKTEDDLETFGIRVVAGEAMSPKEKESKETLLPSGESELVISEEDKPATERKVGSKSTGGVDDIAEPELVIVEEDNLATEARKIVNMAKREMVETTNPEPATTEEDKYAKEESKTGNITKEEVDEVAKPHPDTAEEDKYTKEEKIGNMVMPGPGQKNMLIEPKTHEGQNESVSKRKIQSSGKDESEYLEEMETQEVGLGYAVKDVKYRGEQSEEMETEDIKCPGEEGDVEMEDSQ
ncbi:opioid growth factor receptor-like protein 1 isoform X2 [Heterodontus francisci]|uniref:opioid growth factor receptor-like protein 1 isoform X2 n=1 Tax=Heterodontus francisci TaxID=7792 RepID=UPI00355C299B